MPIVFSTVSRVTIGTLRITEWRTGQHATLLVTTYLPIPLAATMGPAVQPQNQQGFMLWFETQARPDCLNHPAIQNYAQWWFLFKHVKYVDELITVKSLDVKK